MISSILRKFAKMTDRSLKAIREVIGWYLILGGLGGVVVGTYAKLTGIPTRDPLLPSMMMFAIMSALGVWIEIRKKKG